MKNLNLQCSKDFNSLIRIAYNSLLHALYTNYFSFLKGEGNWNDLQGENWPRRDTFTKDKFWNLKVLYNVGLGCK